MKGLVWVLNGLLIAGQIGFVAEVRAGALKDKIKGSEQALIEWAGAKELTALLANDQDGSPAKIAAWIKEHSSIVKRLGCEELAKLPEKDMADMRAGLKGVAVLIEKSVTTREALLQSGSGEEFLEKNQKGAQKGDEENPGKGRGKMAGKAQGAGKQWAKFPDMEIDEFMDHQQAVVSGGDMNLQIDSDAETVTWNDEFGSIKSVVAFDGKTKGGAGGPRVVGGAAGIKMVGAKRMGGMGGGGAQQSPLDKRLGMKVRSQDEEDQKAAGGKVGVLVKKVDEDGPADTSGLKVGDLILTVDGQDVPDMAVYKKTLKAHEAGEVVKLTYLRDGKVKTTEIDDEVPAPAQGGGMRQMKMQVAPAE